MAMRPHAFRKMKFNIDAKHLEDSKADMQRRTSDLPCMCQNVYNFAHIWMESASALQLSTQFGLVFSWNLRCG